MPDLTSLCTPLRIDCARPTLQLPSDLLDSYLPCDLRGLLPLAKEADASTPPVAVAGNPADAGSSVFPGSDHGIDVDAIGPVNREIARQVADVFAADGKGLLPFCDASLHPGVAFAASQGKRVALPGAVASALGASLRTQSPAVVLIAEEALAQAGGEELASALKHRAGVAVVALRRAGLCQPKVGASDVAAACGVPHQVCASDATEIHQGLAWLHAEASKSTPGVLVIQVSDSKAMAHPPGALWRGAYTRLVGHLRKHTGDASLVFATDMSDTASDEDITTLPDVSSTTLAAEACARASGQATCAVVGPGGSPEAMGALVQAKTSGSPLVLLVAGCLDQGCLLRTAHSFCKDVMQSNTGSQFRATFDEACQLAQRQPQGPVLLCLDSDIFQNGTYAEMDPIGPVPVPRSFPEPPKAREVVVERVAAACLQAKRLLVILGPGLAGPAEPLLTALVERARVCVVTHVEDRGLAAASRQGWHAAWLCAGLGAGCPAEARGIAASCDVALILGARLGETDTAGYTLALPEVCFHVDPDLRVPGANLPAHPIHASVEGFARQLQAALEKAPVASLEDRADFLREIHGCASAAGAPRAWSCLTGGGETEAWCRGMPLAHNPVKTGQRHTLIDAECGTPGYGIPA